MNNKHTIWPAQMAELPIVMQLLTDRVNWLRRNGSDQWSTFQRWEPEMIQSIKERRTLLLREQDSTPVGTLTMSHEGDPDFWSPSELKTPALYLSKLATRPDRAGQGLGRLMLDYALYQARAERLTEMRIDVWRTADELHKYYVDQGWTYLRTVEAPSRFSGTLLVMPVDVPKINQPPTGLEVRPPGGAVTPSPEEPSRHSVASFAPAILKAPDQG